jgi:hypothetical protein
MRIRIKQSRPQNLNDAIRLAVELETFNRAERRVTEGRSYLRTTAADSTAGKISDQTKDQTDMMKLMTDMQKRLSDLPTLISFYFAPKWSCSSATTSNILTFLISL